LFVQRKIISQRYVSPDGAVLRRQEKPTKKALLGTPVIKQVSRFFELSFEIDLICAVFRKTNAKALLTTNGHQKRYVLG